MNNSKENEGGTFLNLFELGDSMFNKHDVEETVKEIDANVSSVTEIDLDETVKTDEPDEITEEIKTINEPEEQDSNDIESIVNSLVTDSILLFDEEKEYDSSISGLKVLIQETISKKEKDFEASYKAKLGEEGAALIEILENGGTIDDYLNSSKQIDFADVPLIDAKGNVLEENLTYLIEDWLNIQGYSKEEIEEVIESYKEKDLLEKQGEMAKKKLVAWQEESIVKREKAKELEIERVKQETIESSIKFEKDVTSVRELAGFKITEEKAKALHTFITKPSKSGKTGLQEKDTFNNRLLFAYLAMEDFNKDKLTRDVATKQAIKLKKALSNFKDTDAAPQRANRDSVTSNATKDVVAGINWMY